ncbi:unnamed protein product [Rhizophagus irregularis]|nr:unnamed protein product [Rhizophagus irregularis]
MSSETNKDGTVILLDKSTVETLSETSVQADDFEHQSQPESTNTENKNFFKGWKKTIFVDDSSNIKVTFHVYLPSFEFAEGYPIVVGNIEELDPISIPLDRFNNYEVKYKYAFFIPKPRIEGKSKFSLFTKPKSDEKKKYNDDDPDEGDLYSEENEQLRLLEKKTGFKFDIAQNLSIYSNIGRWLFYNCNSFEILRFIWTDIIEHTTERDIQLIKYFCLRVEQLISSSHATSLNNYYRSGSYDSNDSNFIYEIYYYLSIIFPIVGKHAKIFKDLLDVAAGRAKNCALSNISNILTITPVISTLEKEIHDSYGEMLKRKYCLSRNDIFGS